MDFQKQDLAVGKMIGGGGWGRVSWTWEGREEMRGPRGVDVFGGRFGFLKHAGSEEENIDECDGAVMHDISVNLKLTEEIGRKVKPARGRCKKKVDCMRLP